MLISNLRNKPKSSISSRLIIISNLNIIKLIIIIRLNVILIVYLLMKSIKITFFTALKQFILIKKSSLLISLMIIELNSFVRGMSV